MEKIVLLNKPAGITSFSAVSACRRILNEKKAGHTGTLDPQASGLMIILLGKSTKLLPYCIHDRKSYHAEFCFGKRTDTEDIWGSVLEEKQPEAHTDEQLQKAMDSFIGDSIQVPPMYSAIKVNGKKLYEYARKGQTVERKPRNIHIYDAAVRKIDDNQYSMDVTVSSGTYIRTLITDFAASLSEFGCMTSLVRTAVDGIKLSQAVTLEELNSETCLLDARVVLDPSIPVMETDQTADILNGKPIHLECESPLVILKYNDDLLAAYAIAENGTYHCQRGLF